MPLKNASKIGLSIACILCTPWIANAGIDKEWKIKNDEWQRKNNQCLDEFRSAQFKEEKGVDPVFPADIPQKSKRWVVKGRKV